MPLGVVHTAGCEYNVYCDESRHTSDPNDRFMVIGAVSCPTTDKRRTVNELHRLKAQFSAQGEIGWKRVSPNKQAFYLELVRWFVASPQLQFRVLVADKTALTFADNDPELGFYKLYYQMLLHWLTPGCDYHVLIDRQQDRERDRVSELRRILRLRLGAAGVHILSMEPAESHSADLIQITDLLIGVVGYECNGRETAPYASPAKVAVARTLAAMLGLPNLKCSTRPDEPKFNVYSFPKPRFPSECG